MTVSGWGCITAICGSFAVGNNVSEETAVSGDLSLFPGKVFWLSIQFPFLLIEMTYLKCLVSFKSLWYPQKKIV